MITVKDTMSSISSLRVERFLKAHSMVKKLVNILVKKYHVSRIFLIGSLANKDRFGFHSDIDLCVEGLQDELYFAAVGELLSEAGEFDVDIIPFEGVAPEIKKRVEKGKVLYEKK